MTKKKIRRLMGQAGKGLMLGAFLFFPAAILSPDSMQATANIHAGLSVMCAGALIDVSKCFI